MKYISTLFALITIVSACHAADYFVAPTGSDQNSGSLDAPFATIQKAIDKANPGDRCLIREGSYRESIDLRGKFGVAKKPIVISAYQGETVILDGTEPITSEWTLDKDNVYQTTLSKDISQLFVDGKLMTLARFPNALAFSEKVWQRNGGARCNRSRESTNGHVIGSGSGDRSIAEAGFSFNGCVALLNFGAHATGTRIVEQHASGSDEFKYQPPLLKYKTTLPYFFEGGIGAAERRMLDIPEEWAYDETKKILYLHTEDSSNPTGRQIIGKTRDWAITGDAATKHIVINGLDFFSAAFQFTGSDFISIRNCDFKYYTSSKRALGILGPSATCCFQGSIEDPCIKPTVYNCTFQYADGSGMISSYVENMAVENNLFHQIDYACANNDNGKGQPFSPSNAISFNKVKDLLYRRNTLSVSGNAQGFSANRNVRGKTIRYIPNVHTAKDARPIVCELNFHTQCGLLHTDGSSLYMPELSVLESVTRYNWFINNGQRDFRWDGDNTPLTGVHANIYRNVAMSGPLKRHSPTGGDGYRLKGDYHEIYHNLGINRGSDLNVARPKGGNRHSITRNNAATHFGDSIEGIESHNRKPSKKAANLKTMLRDYANWDFRPKADATELIDQGIKVEYTWKGKSHPLNHKFNGSAPDIGAYEYGDDRYWIPGQQTAAASMPVPKNEAINVPLDADLMYLIGLNGTKARVSIGKTPDDLTLLKMKKSPQNIVPAGNLEPNTTYYWQVTTIKRDGSQIKGDIWSFTTSD